MRPLLVLSLLCLFAVPAALADTVEDALRYHGLKTRADEAYEARNMSVAEPLLTELVGMSADDPIVWLRLADARYVLGDHPGSITAYERAFAMGGGQPWNTAYNLACCYSLVGNVDKAFEWLERSLAVRWEDRPFFLGDSDLNPLHDDPRWAKVAGILPPNQTFTRTTGWAYDLAFFGAEVKRLHYDPFLVHSEAEFDERLAALESRIDGLSDMQLACELQKLVASLGDGHSHVRMGGAHGHDETEGRVTLRNGKLPIQVYDFDNGRFIVRAGNGHDDLVGTELIQVGSLPVEEAVSRVSAFVPHDNASGARWMLPIYLASAPILENIGAIPAGAGEDGSAVELRVVGPDGIERTVSVAPDAEYRVHLGLPPVSVSGAEQPPYLVERDRPYYFEPMADGRALYVAFNSVRNDRHESLADFSTRLRGAMDKHPFEALVLDVRNNGGGNSFLFPPLVRALLHFEAARPGAPFYALIGRNTFSAAQNFTTDVDWWTQAVFVGEPTGSRPSFIGESTTTRLPWSGVEIGLSSRFHQQSVPGDERVWIAPSIPVPPTSADYFAGRDAPLEAVLQLLGQTGDPDSNTGGW